jgi:N-methylhydantoinase A
MQLIGVDTGGTFTDVVVITGAGRLAVAKALSTPGRVEQGVLDALDRAAAELGTTLPRLLTDTDVLAHGTTVGLNALLTGAGARVGLLTTSGFESTMAIAKANKIHDLPVLDLHAPARWAKPSTLVRRTDTVGIAGRIDAAGAEVDPVDDDQARAAITRLTRHGVESLAVCLLWSPVNPAHELRIRKIAAEVAPELRVTLSSQLASRIGEYERMCTAVVDAYVAPLVSTYVERLEDRLRALGFAGAFLMMRMGGGVQPAAVARQHPISTLRSGPAGGVSAAQQLGRRYGLSNVIATDVGGTSFDVGLVVDGEPQYARRPTIDRLPIATRAVDIASIGTGGGSIAWIDDALGALRVGPHTAAANPGPACYGLGGTAPTLTDAAVVLGYVEQLGGALHLDRGAAVRAVKTHIADPLGLDVETAAEGIVRVACEQMRDLIRRTTIQRGFDPADFALMVYGGAGPQYGARFAADLGVTHVIVPMLAAGLSAYGALAGELRVRSERDLRPQPLIAVMDQVEQAFGELESEVRTQLRGAGREQDVTITRSVGLRFYRQLHRVDVESEPGVPVEELAKRFRDRYEHVVGADTAPDGTPVEVVSVGVEAKLATAAATLPERPHATAPPARHTSAVFDGTRHSCAVFSWPELGNGQEVTGPAFVESETTTAIILPGQRATVAASGDLFLDLATDHTGADS